MGYAKQNTFARHRPFDLVTCEIVTIGSELLLGQIVDTNAVYLAQKLNHIGIEVRFRVSVADHLDEMEQAIRAGLSRCDMVITTGGLGPTLDDLTRETVAKVGGVTLEFRQDLMDQIERVFQRAGYRMAENNRRQAFIPAGSDPIPNPVGTAPGFIMKIEGKPIICLPGVPRELEYLLDKKVIPWLRQEFQLGTITYRVLKATGIGESKVDKEIGDLMKPGKNPEVGLLASLGEIKIRITAKARNEKEAQGLIKPVEEEISRRLGKRIFGADGDSIESVVDSLLSQYGATLSILETFSGGLAAQRLHLLPCPRLVESLVIADENKALEHLGLTNTTWKDGREVAEKVRKLGNRNLALGIIGFPKTKEKHFSLRGLAVVAGKGIEQTFDWTMGGDLYTLQQRGALIGLNTLRLALLEALDE